MSRLDLAVCLFNYERLPPDLSCLYVIQLFYVSIGFPIEACQAKQLPSLKTPYTLKCLPFTHDLGH